MYSMVMLTLQFKLQDVCMFREMFARILLCEVLRGATVRSTRIVPVLSVCFCVLRARKPSQRFNFLTCDCFGLSLSFVQDLRGVLAGEPSQFEVRLSIHGRIQGPRFQSNPPHDVRCPYF
jgi:hypothetical protein